MFSQQKIIFQAAFMLGASLFPAKALAEKAALDLGTLGGRTSIARDINQQGVVVGEAETKELETHAFIWEEGVMSDLGVLKGKYSMANGLNDKNQVVGYAAKTAGGAAVGTDAVLWEKGTITKLPSYKAAFYSQASEINNQEEIVGVSGSRAIVWRKRKPIALPSLGGSHSIALGINNKGWIIGNSATKKDETHATLWKNDKPIDLGTLGGRFSNANGINEAGAVVGSSETAEGKIHGFMWIDGVMKDLGPGMLRSINAKGWVTGEHETDGEPEAFLTDASAVDFALGTFSAGEYSSGFSVNDFETVVGVNAVRDAEGYSHFHASLWQ